MANQHGDNGGIELLGGSQVIAPDGTVAAALPRGKEAATDSCACLISRLPLRDALTRAAGESGALLACRRPGLYTALAM